MADGTPVEFNSLPALERVKLMTHGDGVPPYPGYVWDWDDPEPRWKPGEGVEDVHAVVKEDWLAKTPLYVVDPAANTVSLAKVYLTVGVENHIVAAYSSRARAERDIELIKRAFGPHLDIVELEIEG